MAPSGCAHSAGRRARLHADEGAYGPHPRRIPALGRLPRRQRCRLQPGSRNHSSLLHRCPGAGDRRTDRHRKRDALAAAVAALGANRARRNRRHHQHLVGGPAPAQPCVRSGARRRDRCARHRRRDRDSRTAGVAPRNRRRRARRGSRRGIRGTCRVHHRHRADASLRRHSLCGPGDRRRFDAWCSPAGSRGGRGFPGGFTGGRGFPGGGGFGRGAFAIPGGAGARTTSASPAGSSTPARPAPRSSSCCRPTPAGTPGLAPQSTLTQQQAISSQPTTRSWRSAASTVPIRPPASRNSNSTLLRAASTTSSDREAASGVTAVRRVQITQWVEQHFTATTVDGVTVYDLTQPAG